MDKNRKIYEIMNDESSVEQIAEEIATAFETRADNDNVDYSFTINRRSGQVSGQAANTFFYFDTDEGTRLDAFKKAMFADDLRDIQDGSDEEKELVEDMKQFVTKVCKLLSEKHVDRLRSTIRRVVLGNKVDEKIAPLAIVEVVTFDMADYSSVPDACKYLLKVGKEPNSDIDTDKVVMFIQDKQEETKMTIQQIVDFERTIGNPLFRHVIAVQQGRKYLNEVSIYFFVDYSLPD